MTKKVFRRFFEQRFHIEWKIEDGDDGAVARYLCDVFTKKADPFFFTENVRIHIQSVDYCDPQKHGTLQYAIVFCGKLYPLRRIGGAIGSVVEPYPIKDVSELVYITVNKRGTNKSLVNFDTAYEEVFIPFSNKVLRKLQKVFTVEPVENGKTKPEEPAKRKKVLQEKWDALPTEKRDAYTKAYNIYLVMLKENKEALADGFTKTSKVDFPSWRLRIEQDDLKMGTSQRTLETVKAFGEAGCIPIKKRKK